MTTPVRRDCMLARYYSAFQSRFLSADPLSFTARSEDEQDATLKNPQKWNQYAYVLNNPMRYADPTGLTEGSASNVEKRKQINEDAKKAEGSAKWANPTGEDSGNKCSTFVNDTITKAGAPASVTTTEGVVRPPTAGELGNKNSKVSDWRALGPNEKREPGDIAAVKFPDGSVGRTGHTGIVTDDGKGGTAVTSAHADKVSVKPDTLSKEPRTIYRRYTGD